MLSYAINKIIALDPNCNDRLSLLQHKTLAIECVDFPNKVIYCLFDVYGIQLQDITNKKADVTISAPLAGLVKLALDKENTDLHAAKININGDLLVAQAIQELFFNLDIDWEEQLSHFTGDVLAHQAMYWFKKIKDYQKSSSFSLQQMVSEYLQEEVKVLPTKYEIEGFIQAVDDLRFATDRAAARIKEYESN